MGPGGGRPARRGMGRDTARDWSGRGTGWGMAERQSRPADSASRLLRADGAGAVAAAGGRRGESGRGREWGNVQEWKNGVLPIGPIDAQA
jgi:hypothetical protein